MYAGIREADTAVLIQAEIDLRFQGVNHGSDFRARQIARRLDAIRSEIARRREEAGSRMIERSYAEITA